ncbi:23S rRNA (guanosine(2251)-2'-O)-methyltransferase RlmB [Chryseobacterium carnipullorum]|uniref:23S rRNA (Guanosine(2251)-2'-O)-methyltransferase RlmB n=1 Tax=Chryseobacterium carnipullorum TaxID=1124835 RepID=A0A3G6M0M5_CHRCU|nr:23S rRNA (guanosine(2251)-2'-O)-methyltransferase RlmB [Chryseobacterium carnipullorum]MDN5395971.1 23S rRNA (guanosine(2251)-2'-O)-methyltransferase RlmB [Chryseobacterium sp.]AZA49092.1 23S rRNA (guanosine(2251)-2'-O)-methyltransferase RlmB [Chryseobacterium carnipullorum]AZA63986.1 23S rRNA (guanosine(2251)-2'-O)-methyltransferase RlmB [Chryseobacterium carnipullorum]MDN5479490.1 23S rRNA (guanosine(2251)-2'-O)-methyltransferase RlmB [Chryseobacterium sp.]HBV14638.1 23S rRNA (guanosine(2
MLTNENKKDDFIFGLRPVIEAIEAGKTIDKIFVQNALQGPIYAELKTILAQHKIRPNYVPIEKLNRFTRKNHQGVVAFISDVPFHRVEDIVPQLFEEGKTPFLLILDRLTDVRNFGAICRTAECVGVDAIIIPEKGGAPINSDAIKTSAGALYNIKICKEPNLAHAVDFLQQSGISVFAATEKAQKLIYDVNFTEPCAIVMGNEETGISKEVMHHSDEKIKLPIEGKTQSLNVSVACGAILYEAVRQKIVAAASL